MTKRIEARFVRYWSDRYCETVNQNDEVIHEELTREISCEIREMGTISKETLQKLVSWMIRRNHQKIEWDDYANYERGIRAAQIVPDSAKLVMLTALKGIGPVVGSGILYFLYPGNFPIMNRHCCESLKEMKYISYNAPDTSKYNSYRDTVLDIMAFCKPYTLRKLDMALNAYNKLQKIS